MRLLLIRSANSLKKGTRCGSWTQSTSAKFDIRRLFYAHRLGAEVSVIAQPDPGKAQPNRLDFGTVRENATVEGSIRVFHEGDKTDDVPFDVQPPPFATISNTKLGTQTYGSLGTRVVCDVSV